MMCFMYYWISVKAKICWANKINPGKTRVKLWLNLANLVHLCQNISQPVFQPSRRLDSVFWLVLTGISCAFIPVTAPLYLILVCVYK